MAPPDDDFIASDAFGDFFFLGTVSGPSKCESSQRKSPVGSTCGGVFTFPVRSRVSTAKTGPLASASSSDSTGSAALDVIADVAATLTLWAPKQAAARELRERKLGADTDDLKAASNGASIDAKLEVDRGELRGYGRSASLDTRTPPHIRDQSGPNLPASTGPAGDQPSTASTAQDVSTLLHSQYLASRRSGSAASSGGGAVHPHHHHHGGWHNTEWWRSFSSSRLNEMAAEEPDWRSPEMRKVPFTGGAEPMCALVHKEEEQV